MCLFPEVLHLIGEPDFRDVRLRWEYGNDVEDEPKLLAFQVHYCELQAWGQYRCRTKVRIYYLPASDFAGEQYFKVKIFEIGVRNDARLLQ